MIEDLFEGRPSGRMLEELKELGIEYTHAEEVAEKLMRLYNFQNLGHVTPEMEKAVDLTVQLAKKNFSVLERVCKDAERYAELMSYEDSDSYNPNSFDVLAKVGGDYAREFIKSYTTYQYLIVNIQARQSLKEMQDE